MRATAAVLFTAVAIAAVGCGDGVDGPVVRVAAASSLREALQECAPHVPGVRVRLELGGSDALAARIRAGVRPDVFAAADLALPRGLARDGLASPPVAFATNELVLAVPAQGSAVRSLRDLLTRPATALALGSPNVPVGAYARALLARLPAPGRRAIEREIRSEEPEVAGVVGKLVTGAADAGFVYRSDVRAAGGRLRAVPLPPRLAPRVVYGVSRIGDAPGARRFVASLLHGTCARALRRAGLGPPP